MFLCRLLVLISTVVLLLIPKCVGAQAPSLDDCREQIRNNPENPVVYYCVYRSVLANGHLDEAAALLRQSFEENPQVFRIEMFIAWIDEMRAKSDSDELLRHAIDGMESTSDHHGVVYGGLQLAHRLGEHGFLSEAEALLDRCARAAKNTGDPAMEARVWIGQAVSAGRNRDYSERLHLILKAQKAVFPDGPYDIRATVYEGLGAVYWYLCRYREAFDAFESAGSIHEQAHDLWGQARSAFNMSLCAGNLRKEGAIEVEEYRRILENGRRLAIESGNLAAESEMTVLLGWLYQGEEAMEYFHSALNSSRERALIQTEVNALRALGIASAKMGPQFREESGGYFLQAKQRARETGHDFLLGETLTAEARIKLQYRPREEGIAAHLESMDLIERIRAPQVGGAIRAQAFARWMDVYYRLAGFLLLESSSSNAPGEDRALAFETIERFRARELLESIEAPLRIRMEKAGNETSSQRDEVLARISEIQRALSDPGLSPSDRQTALTDLKDLEDLEADLRDRLLREFQTFAAQQQPVVSGLSDVQALLEPDQALLSFQLWDGESAMRSPLEIGKSWLIVVTRDEVRAIGLPGRRDIRGRVEIFEGLLSGRDAPANFVVKASVRLYKDLLEEALAMLPEGTRSLVIIPDDVLFHCPFGGLRTSEDEAPLGSQFEISIVPSAAVWVHLKGASRTASPERRSAALILSDPAIGEPDEEPSGSQVGNPWAEGLRLAPLRHAGNEARSLERVAGRGSLVLSGAAASEGTLKNTPLSNFGIIDLVTHAVVDEEQPERSAILLAPGSDDEDGFLQVREIPDLELDGQLVILSSCRSSSGTILGGEGAQSLARAFLEAGAGAVLASLWPLEDEHASILLGSFSRALGQGRSVAGALIIAQRDAVDSGMPAASWAGLVILGDGDLRLIPDRDHRVFGWILIGAVVAFSYGVFKVARFRRGSLEPHPDSLTIK